MTMAPFDNLVFGALAQGASIGALVALIFTLLIFVKSLVDFTRTGPQMTDEVLTHYRLYLAYSLAVLIVFAFLITFFMAFVGVTAYAIGLILLDAKFGPVAAAGASLTAIFVLTGRRFVRTLLFSPGVIAASSLYSIDALLPAWEPVTPARLARSIRHGHALWFWLGAGIGMLAPMVLGQRFGFSVVLPALRYAIIYCRSEREPLLLSPAESSRSHPTSS